jgi:hypothetical protein
MDTAIIPFAQFAFFMVAPVEFLSGCPLANAAYLWKPQRPHDVTRAWNHVSFTGKFPDRVKGGRGLSQRFGDSREQKNRRAVVWEMRERRARNLSGRAEVRRAEE